MGRTAFVGARSYPRVPSRVTGRPRTSRRLASRRRYAHHRLGVPPTHHRLATFPPAPPTKLPSRARFQNRTMTRSISGFGSSHIRLFPRHAHTLTHRHSLLYLHSAGARASPNAWGKPPAGPSVNMDPNNNQFYNAWGGSPAAAAQGGEGGQPGPSPGNPGGGAYGLGLGMAASPGLAGRSLADVFSNDDSAAGRRAARPSARRRGARRATIAAAAASGPGPAAPGLGALG